MSESLKVPKRAAGQHPKPPEGSWTEHNPELDTAPVSYESAISPEFFELEREAVFKRAWLNVGRVEQLPRKGGFFTKELPGLKTSLIVVRGKDERIRAFHNVCRHRGNKLVWTDHPGEEVSGTCRQFACKYHGWTYDLEGRLTFILQEERVLRDRQGRLPPRVGALRHLEWLHLRELRRAAGAVAHTSSSAR